MVESSTSKYNQIKYSFEQSTYLNVNVEIGKRKTLQLPNV